MTGLQEAQKFQKHLQSCKKHPNRLTCDICNGTKKVESEEVGWEGIEIKCWCCRGTGKINPSTGLLGAVEIRAESGQ